MEGLSIRGVFLLSVCLSFGVEHLAFASEAGDSPPPRGANIGASAGHCSMGPFGKTGDAGPYQGYCNKLSNDEKCAGYLLQHLGEKGQLYKADDKAKATFCFKSILSKTID